MRPSAGCFRTSGGYVIPQSVTVKGDMTMDTGKVFTVAAGTITAPSVRFAGSSSNTGFYASTADQVQIGRAGVGSMTLTGASGASCSTSFGVSSTLNATSTLNIGGKLGLAAETVKTGAYTAANTDAIIPCNGAAFTVLSPPVPGGDQTLIIINFHATDAVTFGRNGTLINGAAADVTVAANTMRLLSWNATAGSWYTAT
jgi:hypothetical protein